MKFDPYKVTRMDLDGDILVDDPNGNYTYSDDFDEMRDWWEERGKEIDKLYERLGKINEICEEGL